MYCSTYSTAVVTGNTSKSRLYRYPKYTLCVPSGILRDGLFSWYIPSILFRQSESLIGKQEHTLVYSTVVHTYWYIPGKYFFTDTYIKVKVKYVGNERKTHERLFVTGGAGAWGN